MKAVDRGDFTQHNPYEDCPQSIGYGATISAPHMHATALEKLQDVIKENSKILDVGSGSGYLAACFAKMIGPAGKVIGIEHIEELVDLSDRNVRKHHADLLESGRLELLEGDGRLGYPKEAPYDAIHVGAAADKLPQALVEQLAVGGRMLIPVGSGSHQQFLQVDKVGPNEVKKRNLADVIYVPLTNKTHQLGRMGNHFRFF
ncbi:L-isoaspartate [Aphelenchoides avenae]|nr:L-isoaspartate [Aphelenchus avenae]